MKPCQQKFASLGEVVATAFDQAEGYSANPAEVAHLASLAVLRLWLRNMQALTARARKQGLHPSSVRVLRPRVRPAQRQRPALPRAIAQNLGVVLASARLGLAADGRKLNET